MQLVEIKSLDGSAQLMPAPFPEETPPQLTDASVGEHLALLVELRTLALDARIDDTAAGVQCVLLGLVDARGKRYEVCARYEGGPLEGAWIVAAQREDGGGSEVCTFPSVEAVTGYCYGLRWRLQTGGRLVPGHTSLVDGEVTSRAEAYARADAAVRQTRKLAVAAAEQQNWRGFFAAAGACARAMNRRAAALDS